MTTTRPGQPTALDDARAYLHAAPAGSEPDRDEAIGYAQASALISIAEALHQLTPHDAGRQEQP